MLYGDTRRLESHVETHGRRCGCHHYKRTFAVAAVERLVEVGLLGLGRETGGGAAALHVNYHQRELGHHGKADGLTFQGQTGA